MVGTGQGDGWALTLPGPDLARGTSLLLRRSPPSPQSEGRGSSPTGPLPVHLKNNAEPSKLNTCSTCPRCSGTSGTATSHTDSGLANCPFFCFSAPPNPSYLFIAPAPPLLP